MRTCSACGGAIGEMGKAYGYAGKWCCCESPRPDGWPHVTVTPGTVQDLWKQDASEKSVTPAEFMFWLRGYAAHGHVDPKILAELQKRL